MDEGAKLLLVVLGVAVYVDYERAFSMSSFSGYYFDCGVLDGAVREEVVID